MDKLRILKEFEKLALGDALEIDEIRLYLLLLAYCGRANNGEIAYKTVKYGLGEGFSPARFEQALLRLSGNNLIELVSPLLDWCGVEDFILAYRIFPYARKERQKSGGDMKAVGVLIVDDEPYILDLAASFFKCEGVETYCAANGGEALRKLRERTFIMMVTDFNMPGMDGLELASKAREIAPHMPVIMNTGNITPEIRRLAKEAGIAEVFSKPFHLEEILAMVKKRMDEEKNRGW